MKQHDEILSILSSEVNTEQIFMQAMSASERPSVIRIKIIDSCFEFSADRTIQGYQDGASPIKYRTNHFT
jgi:hypothetical protein